MSRNKNNNDDDENSLSFHLLRQNSIQSIFEPVKIENQNHENNCFVSVVFHSLFHFFELKEYLINLQLKINSPKLIIELTSIINYYQQINKDKNQQINGNILNPLSFRKELANLFEKENQFQLNEQGDPIELLNFLLNILHTFIISNETKITVSDEECKNNCLIHKLFYINLIEYNLCYNCQKKKCIKYDNNYFIHLINVNVLFENIKKAKNFNDLKGNLILFSINGNQKCKTCKNKMQTIYECKAIGKYFILNLGWNGNANMENLCNLYTLIGKEFELNKLFKKCQNKKFYFKGMFLYWSNHYICLFYEKKLKQFVIYDDKLIKKFSSWIELIENLIKGYYQPVALIYGENEDNILDFEINEKFYNKMIKFSIENDKDKELIAIANVNIKENEWECEWCKKININDNDICINCGRNNSTITLLLNEKYEILKNINVNQLNKEDKLFIENYQKKKNLELNTEKWICPVCQCKTNLITNPFCTICNVKNNDLVNKKVEIEFNNNQNNKNDKNENIERKDIKLDNNNEKNNFRRNSLEDKINNNEKEKKEKRDFTINGFEKRKKEEQRLQKEINSNIIKNIEKKNKNNINKENQDIKDNNLNKININKSMMVLSNPKEEQKLLKNIDNNIEYNYYNINSIENNKQNKNEIITNFQKENKIVVPKNSNLNKSEINNSSNINYFNSVDKYINKKQQTKISNNVFNINQLNNYQMKNEDLRKVEQSINDIEDNYKENKPAALSNNNNNNLYMQNRIITPNEMLENYKNINKSQISNNYKDDIKNKKKNKSFIDNNKSEDNKIKKNNKSVIHTNQTNDLDKRKNIFQSVIHINQSNDLDIGKNIFQNENDIYKKTKSNKKKINQSQIDNSKTKEREKIITNNNDTLYNICSKCNKKYLNICENCQKKKFNSELFNGKKNL